MKPTDLEDVLQKFAIFGRYHRELLLFVALAYASNALYCSNFIFAAEEVKYRCADESFGNNTCSADSTCTEWVYENPNTFVAEFQLACQEWKRTLVGTIRSLGYMLGLLVIGPLSDRLGRKKALVLTGVTGGVLGVAKSFSPWYWLYIFLEFIESAVGDICSPIFVLSIEFVATKKRVPYSILCGLGYCLGGVLLPLAAWGIGYWRNVLRVIYAPALLFLLYIYVIDESPRWLLTKGKKEKAIEILQKAADKNKLEINKGVLENLYCEEDKGIGFINLLKITFGSRTLLCRCLICIVWWSSSTFVNYGMMINSVSLQGNKYINYALLSLVDVPACFIVMYILIYFKRKIPLILSFILGAILCLVQPFLPDYLAWLSVVVYMLGKLMSSVYFNITYIYTSELFPTYTRNSMHALCSSLGRIGSILAPQTPLLMVYWTGLPALVFGAAALVGGAVTFLVPETGNEPLPDTVKEAEIVGQSGKKMADQS
ncbi:hypothetical protein O3G_MSEX005178 [Manduca sexta]|uniref:Major facilitator superfamily (MFS) profile domain-containing protein n=1 Tax=Manduca sexta TaxID=7130 RepID=A0A922CJE4_MANSE|nr:hypothetical protein O3G_MSEX005178 [Manduca sexta]